jgi:hypothetical protein
VVFALAHNLTFAFTYGIDPGAALARTGYGAHWTATMAVIVVLAATLSLAGVLRLAELSRLTRELDAGRIAIRHAGGRYLGREVSAAGS